MKHHELASHKSKLAKMMVLKNRLSYGKTILIVIISVIMLSGGIFPQTHRKKEKR